MPQPELTVILCSHNPRADYLARVMVGLTRQSLARERWELLVIDNASDPPISAGIDLSWHPLARIVREEALGLTQARLRGYREAGAGVLVFVDDDNVLAP